MIDVFLWRNGRKYTFVPRQARHDPNWRERPSLKPQIEPFPLPRPGVWHQFPGTSFPMFAAVQFPK